jgi:tetratricopeptide (TPR) repeat protein
MPARPPAFLGRILGGVLLLSGGPAFALDIDGEYESPLGRVRVEGDGVTFRGVVVAPGGACRFRAGDEVLRATLLDDSLAGQVRVCVAGEACRAREAWSSAVLLVGEGRLTGAVHVAEKGCRAPVGKRGGIALVRAGATATPTSTPTATSELSLSPGPGGGMGAMGARSDGDAEARRARARAILRDGAARLEAGSFEAARRRFLEAVEVDPRVPEAYNGVGVTYRMRNDLAAALEWYKRALAVDPDFGDAYYNMACVYALEGRKDMALRYLQIAALNGYATADGIDADPDLAPLRAEPGYRALVRARM